MFTVMLGAQVLGAGGAAVGPIAPIRPHTHGMLEKMLSGFGFWKRWREGKTPPNLLQLHDGHFGCLGIDRRLIQEGPIGAT